MGEGWLDGLVCRYWLLVVQLRKVSDAQMVPRWKVWRYFLYIPWDGMGWDLLRSCIPRDAKGCLPGPGPTGVGRRKNPGRLGGD